VKVENIEMRSKVRVELSGELRKRRGGEGMYVGIRMGLVIFIFLLQPT
jgi:hypothetical protein